MVTKSAILEFASTSGLLNDKFTLENLKAAFSIRTNILNVKKKAFAEQIAQLIARFLREQMLLHKKRFSFETVFSHESNIDIMRRAAEMGYKVYLYFVSTSSALVNKYRVELRVKEGGHGVPAEKIASRYYRSLDLLYDAMEVSYHAYVFDNSVDGEPYRLLYEQKVTGKSVSVVEYDKKDWPEWFKEYFIFKKKASTKPPKKK